MTRQQRSIVERWVTVIRRAIALGEDDAAYRLTRGYLRRCVEIGLL